MTHQEVLDHVISYVKEHFNEQVKDVNADTKLLSTRLLDSISTLHMVSDLEEFFKFDAEAHEVNPDNLDSPGRIAKYISGKIGA
jgi:acyl carrier protein